MNCWLQTYTGRKFTPLEPNIEDINIFDIAHSLSNQCRFSGHCLRFYSVAEHCVHTAALVRPELKLVALMHDAAEAYLVDLPTPIKRNMPLYAEAEKNLEIVIASKYGFPYPIPQEVKMIDSSLLSDEREQNMAWTDTAPGLWGNPTPAAGIRLNFWKPEQAKDEFLNIFFKHGGKDKP
jgi:hypothetical protein